MRSLAQSRAALLLLCLSPVTLLHAQTDLVSLRKSFLHPPDDTKIMMRWWWFGPAIEKPELQRELEQMKAAGIGGVEIATLYPQALDDPSTGFHNVPYLSDEYIDDLRYVASEARRLGLRVDVTLGSGWPLGGPHIPVTEAAGELRIAMVPVAPGASSILAPSLEAGERLLQTFLVPGEAPEANLQNARSLSKIDLPRLQLATSPTQPATAIFFISSRTGMMVKRPAVGASGFVLDHYDKRATNQHLLSVGDRLLQAFGDKPPYAVFSDSLEDYGSDWTPDLLDEFRRRRGYDLAPYLPALIGDNGPSTAAIRHDWGRTLTELADANFLAPMHTWAQQHHTLFRSQTYGFPPVTLFSNRYADLPEGEGKATLLMWRQFSDTRWAASAGHLFGKNVISSETWTWLHSPAFRATPLDMKAEADLHFLQGINQLVGHGWPYSPPGVPEPGWRMYAAAALDAHNPWFQVMPDLTIYLQRVSFALRLGTPVSDVAVLLPNDDIWASFKARLHTGKSATSSAGFDETGSNISIDESMNSFLDKNIVPQILDAGFSFDFIDADTIDSLGIPYRVLVLPGIDRIPPATYEKIAQFAHHGGIVIATGRLPSTAPGFLHAAEQTSSILETSHTLFHTNLPNVHFVQASEQLGSTLATSLQPDLVLSPPVPRIGFVHRKLGMADLYFLANTTNEPQHVRAHFRSAAAHAQQWDAFSGGAQPLPAAQDIQLDLEPYESRIFVFSSEPAAPTAQPFSPSRQAMDISHDWQLRFPSGKILHMQSLHSWADDPELSSFSGQATYEKTIHLAEAAVQPGTTTVLDFGNGKPIPEPQPLGRYNMQAYLESPVRETAQVFINDSPAGAVWHPPYRLDISSFLHPGANRIRIVVGNSAINQLAAQAQPDYRLLYAKYGVLFVPQDMDHLQPLPSGLLGPITLHTIPAPHP
jgi:hypothetical protein